MRIAAKASMGLVGLFLTFWAAMPSSLQAVKSASIVICATTGKVYTASNPDVITHPASLTKMMTLYLTFQALREGKLKPYQKLPVSKHAMSQSPTKLGLKAGSFITVQDAILGLVIKSANDAAVVLAEALGKGSEPYFATCMTQKARQLGMSHTLFKNASGLPHKQQVTTAREMVLLSRSLYLHFPEYFKFFKEKEFTYKGTLYRNHNKLLGKVEGVDGIKTGFTCASGFNLAASMVRDNRRIIAVVLGGETGAARDKKMKYLLEATYASFKGKPLKSDKPQYASIGDLMHTLEGVKPSSFKLQKAVYIPSAKGKVQKAAYVPKKKSKPVKSLLKKKTAKRLEKRSSGRKRITQLL